LSFVYLEHYRTFGLRFGGSWCLISSHIYGYKLSSATATIQILDKLLFLSWFAINSPKFCAVVRVDGCARDGQRQLTTMRSHIPFHGMWDIIRVLLGIWLLILDATCLCRQETLDYNQQNMALIQERLGQRSTLTYCPYPVTLLYILVDRD
jgi:hypothetical protein